eukprot:GEMP01050594.1.p1 GENE.GEMP01050594.1~~GEMP01050594.1.p1  ORF type:complete len:171 (+),score=21.52 GEMP01050594.1:172-684(+)
MVEPIGGAHGLLKRRTLRNNCYNCTMASKRIDDLDMAIGLSTSESDEDQAPAPRGSVKRYTTTDSKRYRSGERNTSAIDLNSSDDNLSISADGSKPDDITQNRENSLNHVVAALFDDDKNAISETALQKCLHDVEMDSALAARMLIWMEARSNIGSKSDIKLFLSSLLNS